MPVCKQGILRTSILYVKTFMVSAGARLLTALGQQLSTRRGLKGTR